MANRDELAKHLDLTTRQITNLLKQGVIPPAKGRASYDIDASRIAYIRHLRWRASGQGQTEQEPDEQGEVIPNLEAQRDREEYLLIKERRITQQQKNELAAQKVVPTEFAIFTLSRIAAEIATVLDTLPMTMKRKHPDLETRHIDTLLRELARARNIASGLDEGVPDLLDDYFETLNTSD